MDPLWNGQQIKKKLGYNFKKNYSDELWGKYSEHLILIKVRTHLI